LANVLADFPLIYTHKIKEDDRKKDRIYMALFSLLVVFDV